MQFTYTAQGTDKTITEGVIEAPDRLAAAKSLRAGGMLPLSIAERSTRTLSDRFEQFFGHVKSEERILFARNLSGMLTAGLSLYRALEVMKKQTKNQALARVLDGLLDTVNQGGALSDGLAKFPKVFPTLFVAMVRAGEESGKLPDALGEIAASLDKSYALVRKVKGALMYPAVIITVILVVGVLMLIFVVPTITKIFADFGTELPVTTRFLIAVSGAASGHPFLFLFGTGALIFGVYSFFTSPRFAKTSDAFVLWMPGVGGIVREVNTARTARTLSSLLASGVEMTKALGITRDVLQNTKYKAVLDRAIVSVEKGGTLSEIFKAETKLYPVMMGEMAAVGEETGAVTKMFGDIAMHFEEAVDEKTKNLSTIIEPVLMVFIGAAVGFFAISMISPIYGLLSSIH